MRITKIEPYVYRCPRGECECGTYDGKLMHAVRVVTDNGHRLRMHSREAAVEWARANGVEIAEGA